MLPHPTIEKLSTLRLSGMLRGLQEQQSTPGAEQLTFEDRLGLLVDRELMDRENKRAAMRLKHARLRHEAVIEDIDFRHPRGLDKSLLLSLASCQWIKNRDNCAITGPTGVGKSYLACALAQKACREGYSVLYTRTNRLLQELALARTEGSYSRKLFTLARTDLLVLDDWAMAPLTEQQRRDLFEIFDDRYDRHSTLVATQVPVENWHETIGDPTIADALLDRLVHNAHKIRLKGESMRKLKKDKEQDKQVETTDAGNASNT
jgi:DNA replication protein DnaC